MNTNPKLALKVLKQMKEDFISIEASLVQIQDEKQQLELFKQVKDKQDAVYKLLDYYSKIVSRMP